MLFKENIGPHLSIDELSLSQGELYTFVTNKDGKGKKGTLVASIKGTLTKDIVEILTKIPIEERKKVKEVTMDMANNMESSVKQSFPDAILVTDRFHVIRLAIEALQHLRIKYRWEALDKENENIETAKKAGKKYKPEELSNGDTMKQLLARCRYILCKKPTEWTQNQRERTDLLFRYYPELQIGYNHVMELRNIYERTSKVEAEQMLSNWIKKTETLKIKEFNTVSNTIRSNLSNILNFFINRNTNANAESFNSKLKLFRANLRGVLDRSFFLFRVHKLFA